MPRVRLIHWNLGEDAAKAAILRDAGYEVDHTALNGPAGLRLLSQQPPSAVVIDLSRLPSQGRDVALAIRIQKATRHVSLVFVEGDPEKVARICRILPDAVYTRWRRIRSSLKRGIGSHPENMRSHPAVPRSRLEGYSGAPLAKKLGIKPGSVVALVGEPEGFKKTLSDLPKGVQLRNGVRGHRDLTVWFARSRKELENRIHQIVHLADNGGLWIAWPKKGTGNPTDLSQVIVRKVGLAAGIVDYKICAIDATWSGLQFTRRKPN